MALSDVSREICALVGAFNAGPEGVRAAYTFDAGPNAVIYLADDAARDALLPHIAYYFNGGDAPEGGVLEVGSAVDGSRRQRQGRGEGRGLRLGFVSVCVGGWGYHHLLTTGVIVASHPPFLRFPAWTVTVMR